MIFNHWLTVKQCIVFAHIHTQYSRFNCVQRSSPYNTRAYWMHLVHIWNGNVNIGKEVILSNSSICNFQCFYHIRYDEIHRVIAFLGTSETRKEKGKQRRIKMDVANTSNWTRMTVILNMLHSDLAHAPLSVEENENNSIESIEAARFLPNILHEIIFSKVIYVIDLPLRLKERKSPGELI